MSAENMFIANNVSFSFVCMEDVILHLWRTLWARRRIPRYAIRLPNRVVLTLDFALFTRCDVVGTWSSTYHLSSSSSSYSPTRFIFYFKIYNFCIFQRTFDNLSTTFWHFFDNFLKSFWQLLTTFWHFFWQFWQFFDIFLTTLTTFWKFFLTIFDNFLTIFWPFWQLFFFLISTMILNLWNNI
jgi:hypothetical protein